MGLPTLEYVCAICVWYQKGHLKIYNLLKWRLMHWSLFCPYSYFSYLYYKCPFTELEAKDTTDTARSVSYLDLQLEIDSDRRLMAKLYDKWICFCFPIMTFPFICSNISAAPAYGEYISHLIRYFRACISFHDFIDRGLQLTWTISLRGYHPSSSQCFGTDMVY